LLYSTKGPVTIETPEGTLVGSVNRGVWVPGNVAHRLVAKQSIELHSVWVETQYYPDLPQTAHLVSMSPLLRELVATATHMGLGYNTTERNERFFSVLVDNILTTEDRPLDLKIGRDRRLLKVTTPLLDEPGDERSLEEWSSIAGASVRTLARLFIQETGLNFTAWRQKARMLRAVQLLADGHSVTSVAYTVGYDTANAFIAVFKQNYGTTPARFFRD
jgi:AraC-like DNA-binding protein